jgi:hypothetical protein
VNTGKEEGGKFFSIYIPYVLDAKYNLLDEISKEVMPQRKREGRTAKRKLSDAHI